MGKRSKTKADAAPVAVVQSEKKGKRGAENGSEKAVNLKKQKVERDETVAATQKALKKQPKKVASSSSEEDSDDSDSDSEPKVAAKKVPAPAKNGAVKAKNAKKESSSDSSESSEIDSDDSDAKPAAAALKNGAAKESEESETDSDSSDEETVAKAAPAAAPKKKVESSDSDSDEEEDSSDSDEEPEATKPKVQAAKKSDSTDESSEDDDSEEEEDEKTPKKKDNDTEMVDATKSAASKTPKTPATPDATGSKTLFVANLSFDVEESDVRDFFKEAGEVLEVRFAMKDGQFRGFGHVEFETAEAAQKAMELNGKEMLDRPVRLDLARERGAPQSRDNNSSFQKGGRSEGQTAFVRGFDTSLGEDEIRSALENHFASCGHITRTSIPPDFESGGVKGMAYINFADSNALSAALELDGSDLGGGYHLTVQEAKPRGDSAGGSGGRFDRGGGRSGGRRGGRDGGRFSGRGGRDGGRGGRFSGRGGRDGGRGGRGTPFRNSVPSGKKTTFGDD
ncbi:hypothetical protein vseg_018036 [Gypsophila vaccaria]